MLLALFRFFQLSQLVLFKSFVRLGLYFDHFSSGFILLRFGGLLAHLRMAVLCIECDLRCLRDQGHGDSCARFDLLPSEVVTTGFFFTLNPLGFNCVDTHCNRLEGLRDTCSTIGVLLRGIALRYCCRCREEMFILLIKGRDGLSLDAHLLSHCLAIEGLTVSGSVCWAG